MITKELKSIDLIFENVEVINIPAEHVQCLWLDKIIESRFKEWHSNEMLVGNVAKHATIVLKPEANVELKDPINADKVFERVNAYDDLSALTINYTDDTSEDIHLIWGDRDYSNSYQSTLTTISGHFVIVVSKKKTAASETKRIFGASENG